jgi:hypothetical protein
MSAFFAAAWLMKTLGITEHRSEPRRGECSSWVTWRGPVERP